MSTSTVSTQDAGKLVLASGESVSPGGVVVTGFVVTGLVVTGLVVTGVVVADPGDGDVVGSTMGGSLLHARITMHTITGKPIFVRVRDAFTMFGNLT